MSRAQLTSTVEQNTGGAVAPFVAGKNKIINGDFGVWARGTSFTLSGTAYTYTADRIECLSVSGQYAAVNRVAFTPGSAPVAGYEGNYYLSYANVDTSVGHVLRQKIENVTTFAGQTITISFWAKVDTPRTLTMTVIQDFGSGGSTAVGTNVSFADSSLTTSWKRFAGVVTLPSISGKTIGTNSNLAIPLAIPAGNATLSIWGLQVEAGSVATSFTTASGTLQGELALAQRYYFRQSFVAASQHFGLGQCFSSTQAYAVIPFPVTMRTAPTSVETTGSAGDYILLNSAASGVTCTAVPTFSAGWNNAGQVVATVGSGLTAGNATKLGGLNATSAAYLGWSAEL